MGSRIPSLSFPPTRRLASLCPISMAPRCCGGVECLYRPNLLKPGPRAHQRLPHRERPAHSHARRARRRRPVADVLIHYAVTIFIVDPAFAARATGPSYRSMASRPRCLVRPFAAFHTSGVDRVVCTGSRCGRRRRVPGTWFSTSRTSYLWSGATKISRRTSKESVEYWSE
ncbi:uncharacterized protein LOC119319042 [Triticum dicoccoides]|uniref:uncharacterized protein LOC119319042 n=1 Tax=Triticum dicoccoides TaxID=85692 RepID=UPI00189185BB|nr:uncharacterized protein LOC119319042 [Triticum dicoccoides]